MSKSNSPLQKHIEEVQKRNQSGETTLSNIVEIFGGDGHFVCILFLILPFLQPVPLFGLSTPFGILIGIVAFFSYLKRPPYLPEKWKTKVIKKETLSKIALGAEKIFGKLETFLKPRMEYFFKEPFKVINIFILILNAILLALPLPIPFSNAIPAWTILFQTVAHLERDGLFILLSYIQAVISIIFFILLAYGAQLGITWLSMPQI